MSSLARLLAVASLVVTGLSPGVSVAQSAHEAPSPQGGGAPSAEDGTEMRSPGTFVGGVILTTLGTATTAAGAVVVADDQAQGGSGYHGLSTVFIGAPLMVLGGLGVVGGIAMMYSGGRGVPKEPEEASAVPTVTLGATHASARWAF